MNWKAVLTVFLILGISFMLLATNTGRNFIGFFGKIPLSIDKFFSGFSSLLSGSKSGNYTAFALTIGLESKNMFNDQSYQLENAAIKVSGVYMNDLIFDGFLFNKKAKNGEISMKGFNGKFEVTAAGTLRIAGSCAAITVDGQDIQSTKESLTVTTEMYPSEYYVTPIKKDKVSLSPISGMIENIAGVQVLNNDRVDLQSFIGKVELTNTSIKLIGSATKITGTTHGVAFSLGG